MQDTRPNTFLSRQPLAALSKLTIASLLGEALAFLFLLLAIGIFILPLLIVALALLGVAGIVATGVRWVPLAGALAGLGTMIGGIFSQQYFLYHLTHPAEGGPFLLSSLICVCAILSICTGVGATVQNYKSTARQAPRWLPLPFTALGGFVLGIVLVTLLIQATPAAGSTTTVHGEPAVHMGVSNFSQSSVTIPKGSKLLLIDDGSFPHILRNGQWENNVAHPTTEAGAPSIQNVQVNGNSIEIGPFTTAGTFHIYCTIHAGMNLTVIVQ
jgi:plastocyanin